MNDEMFRDMLKTALLAHLQTGHDINTKVREEFQGMFNGTNERRRHLEHHHSIQTSITDKDMLLLKVDMALDEGDMEKFMKLTGELNGMEVFV